MEKFFRLLKDEKGATMVEYALMVVFIAIFCIAAVQLLGGGLDAVFRNMAGQLNP